MTDDDGDKIHITTDEDYRSFLQAMDNERAHLYVVGKNTNTCDLPIHPCVTCDKCKEVIKGTRYKCLICYNYDICMSCEANFRHKNHLMLRIPRTKMFENYKTEMAGRKLELSLNDDGDEIRITTDEDYSSFLLAMANAKARLYVVGKKTTPLVATSGDKDEPVVQCEADAAPMQNDATGVNAGKDLPLHPHIVCDVCDEYIIGHRYKCLMCYDFDICMNCESKFRHKDHLMMRIPRPEMLCRSQTTVSRMFEKLRLYATRITVNSQQDLEEAARVPTYKVTASIPTKREAARSQRSNKHHGEDRRCGETSKPPRASKSGTERKPNVADASMAGERTPKEMKEKTMNRSMSEINRRCKDMVHLYLNTMQTLDPTTTFPAPAGTSDPVAIANAAAAAAAAAAAKATAAANSALKATTSKLASGAGNGESAALKPERSFPLPTGEELMEMRNIMQQTNSQSQGKPAAQQQTGQPTQPPVLSLPFLPFVNLGWPTQEKLMVASENVSKLLDPLGLSFEIRHKTQSQSAGNANNRETDNCTPSTSAAKVGTPSVPTAQAEEASALEKKQEITTEIKESQSSSGSETAQTQTKPMAEVSKNNQAETKEAKPTDDQNTAKQQLECDATSSKHEEAEAEGEMEDENDSQISFSSASLLTDDDQDLIDVAEDVAKSASPSKPFKATEKTWTLVDIPHDEDEDKITNAPLDAIAKLIEHDMSSSSSKPPLEDAHSIIPPKEKKASKPSEDKQKEPKKTSSTKASTGGARLDYENYSKILAEHLEGSRRCAEEDQLPSTSSVADAAKEKKASSTPPNSGPCSTSSSSGGSAGKSSKSARKLSGSSSHQKDFTIYSHRPHVNHAIHTMMTMGFSNHNGWLTQLLESLNGDIPKALDLLLQHRH
uniref:ZZ-type domain-containing protein n=1 Tax=Anopheles christyi TaxID=43041 RepID=A0A182K434_9DIPT